MNEAGLEFGPLTPYGSKLIQCGHSHQKLGLVHREFIQSAVIVYIQPLRSYLEGEMKSICVKIRFEIKKKETNIFVFSERTTNFGNETSRSRCSSIKTKEKSNE